MLLSHNCPENGQAKAPNLGGRLHQKNHEGTKRNIETCNRDYEPRLRTILSGLQGPSDRLNTFANSSSPFAQNGLHGAKPPPPPPPPTLAPRRRPRRLYSPALLTGIKAARPPQRHPWPGICSSFESGFEMTMTESTGKCKSRSLMAGARLGFE